MCHGLFFSDGGANYLYLSINFRSRLDVPIMLSPTKFSNLKKTGKDVSLLLQLSEYIFPGNCISVKVKVGSRMKSDKQNKGKHTVSLHCVKNS